MNVELKEYVDQRFNDFDRVVDQSVTDVRRAIAVAETAMSHRLEGMNEFRAQIQQERGLYITRDYYDARSQAIEVRLRAMEAQLASFQGQSRLIGALSTVAGAALAVLAQTLWR